jgi:putative hydrolase of the HAD superfamily
MDKNTHIVFDLDDTLYKEIDFVKSSYIYINNFINKRYKIDLSSEIESCLKHKISFYDCVKIKFPEVKDFTLQKYLELYRFHCPSISLSADVSAFISKILEFNLEFSIITDGRSISQRNKIESLGISQIVKNVIVSEETGYEKPHLNNFKLLNEIYPDKNFVYIADNTSKDFLAPNILKWDSICILDNGQNIHKQNFALEKKFMPKKIIESFKELML